MKIVRDLWDSNILLKRIAKTSENETIKQKGWFLGMISGTLRASLLGNVLTGKGIVRAGYGNKQGKGILRAGYGSKKVLVPLHRLTNIEIQKYYQKESRFNGVFSRDNLSKNVNDRACLINLDEFTNLLVC